MKWDALLTSDVGQKRNDFCVYVLKCCVYFKECKNNLGKKKILQILKADNYKKEINYIYKRIFND